MSIVFAREGSKFYDFNGQKTIFVATTHSSPLNIHKVMTLCANWYSWGVKGKRIKDKIEAT